MAQKTESKASIIRRRYAELGGSAAAVKAIAAEVGCSKEYVRIVARQRIYAGKSAADMKYEAQPLIQEKINARKAASFRRRYQDPDYRERWRAYLRERYRKRVAERRDSV